MEIFRRVAGVPVVQFMGKTQSQRIVGLGRTERLTGKDGKLAAGDLHGLSQEATFGKVAVGVDGSIVKATAAVGHAPKFTFQLLQEYGIKQTVRIAYRHHDLFYVCVKTGDRVLRSRGIQCSTSALVTPP